MVGGVMELDLHGMNTYQAQIAIDAALRRCGGGVYRLRLIHGYRAAPPSGICCGQCTTSAVK